MKKNLNFNILFLIIFCIAYGAFFSIIYYDRNSRVESILTKHVDNLTIQQSIIDSYFQNDASIAKDDILNDSEVIDTLSKGLNGSKEQRDIQRDKLFNHLTPLYSKLKRKGILQLHFVFPNNRTFLRMHKPHKYNDDLTKFRYSYSIVNKEKRVVTGFEQGKSAHAYRYVFPIFDKNNNHIASAEVSLNTKFIQNKLLKLHKIHTHFLVNKKVFDEKRWKSEELSLKYIQSIEHPDYMYSIVNSMFNKKKYKNHIGFLSQVKDEIILKFKQEKPFAVAVDLDNTSKIISFIPVKNIENNNTTAYLVAYNESEILHNIYSHFNHKVIFSFFIFIFLIYLIYLNKLKDMILLKKFKKSTIELKQLIDAFDKNVIFSKTDLKGNITHVSEAFCKISGYKEDELIGKAHNIIRHADMPKEAFSDLWKKLKAKESWSGEVKNRKKNGDFYWVLSTIEPDYDANGKHIGYYAVRQIITAQKKVEELKFELESINSNLEEKIARRTNKIVKLNEEIQETQREVVFTMGSIAESRSKETGNHVKRVAQYSYLLANYCGLSEKECEMLKQASPMHDIGKVAIPDSILNKPGRFDESERVIMNTHAKMGYDMLKHSNRPLLKMASIVAYEHHEKWDGSGYPKGLKGEDIHIYGRITALADVFDALGSSRVYKEAWDDERIFTMFKEERGKHFDPKLIDIFFKHLDEFLEIRDMFMDN